ncbi:NACHT domain-containing protein [Mycolicibacterium fortuitum]|uniref:NACHT domain-containing protein n=2 Tax=Mycolicibacterium fortuitum TaxID=1766 RepID=A0AAE5AGP7_MYCFO|nr:hypothetical protein [Mycolicibacterium fortuitum]MCV7143093.1 hypothetical protein [Mycolicibacterium fortuitum]MDV7189486.1 hypothetical protein [Mycolicibacterium fortuitum]MDV7202477.1 hypothetical protein [Mycolicibacterium fortuitum]MDV7230826.1 hypothetical protein [Mycolicibacterium fortuitum]MDV7256283.1 hypothetical protein [Mycolicibacterium fortuitum]
MENDFAYEALSPRAFEQLAVALVEPVLGAGLEVFGPGRDGGREATWDGPINWSATDSDDSTRWDGYTVIQVKHCQNPTQDAEADLAWLQSHLKTELDTWMKDGSKRSRFPNYLLVVTNVRLTPGDPGGTMDKLQRWVSKQLGHNYGTERNRRTLQSKGLRQVRFWHRNKLNNVLAGNASVRQRFTPLITVGDVLARIEQLPGAVPRDLLPAVFTDHARKSLETGRWIRFDDAGDGQAKHVVDDVVVNLPVETELGRATALREALDRGDRVLRKSLWYAERESEPPPPRHLVITGAAGNGKSTLTRYLTHIYRAAFCGNDSDGPASLTGILAAANASLRRLDLGPAVLPRWALRVELAAMAEAMGPDDGGPSVYRYMCGLVSARSQVDIQPYSLDAWFKTWPCALMFDGLDEVTHPAVRQRVISEITQLVRDADDNDADLFVIVTTRPTGYTERLLPEYFDQVDLSDFTQVEAAAYAKHITSLRLNDDEAEYRNAIMAKLDKALDTAAVHRLLKTPLQVLVLTVIVANSGVLPTNRYRLFWSYFETVFKREANKSTGHQTFFNTYRTEIEDLHLRVGLILHQRNEATGDLRSRLDLNELRDIAFRRFREDQHPIPKANSLADKLVEVATQRLVLLAAAEDQTVAFDVRSLQELMAGRALIAGGDADTRHNLTTAARSPHWRNAWLFAAGELFTGSNHERDLVLDIVEICDDDPDWPGWLYPGAPELAASILDDGLAANKPRYVNRLIDVALRILDGPMPTEPKNLARGLSTTASDTDHRALIRGKLRRALAGDRMSHTIATALIHYGEFGSRIPGEGDHARYVDLWAYHSGEGERVTVGELLSQALALNNISASPRLQNAIDACGNLVLYYAADGLMRPLETGRRGFDHRPVLAALADNEDARVLHLCLEQIPGDAWPAKALLARSCWPALSRTEIAARLHTFQHDHEGELLA